MIAFDRNSEIFTVPADTSDSNPPQTNLTNDGSPFQGEPSWSPDGLKITFTAGRPNPNGGTEIWWARVHGSDQQGAP